MCDEVQWTKVFLFVRSLPPVCRTKTVLLDRSLDKKGREKHLLHFVAVMKVRMYACILLQWAQHTQAQHTHVLQVCACVCVCVHVSVCVRNMCLCVLTDYL